ncbi:MAG: hypothetical protein ACFFA0_07895 [Promethearchaeota archaeon]
MLLQGINTRIISVYVVQGILVIYYSLLANRILKRKKQRLNLIFSGFYINQIIGFIFNMIYFGISDVKVVKILHFLSVFFVAFGLIFLLIVNMVILESTIIYSIKRQNRYILLYGIILFFGLLILILIPFETFDPTWEMLSFDDSIPPVDRYPMWHPIFFLYQISVITCLAIIPIFYTSFKIYYSFETQELKRKWLYYLIGSLGLVIFNLYPISISNLLNYYQIEGHRSIVSILGITVVLWVSMMYYGIGLKLKK